MRAVFSVLSLLVVVLIIGLLVKKQLGTGGAPTAAPTTASGVTAPTGTPQQQVNQVKQAVEGAMQQPRPMPADEDKK
ncbi:MAG: hypothetical protein H7255_00265 [Ramlibacter sp.]|nr:hypothetical protein [Ramlibacter sp.]